jgi:ribosome-associated protein
MLKEPIPDIVSELTFTTSRSSGPGGQNVNKVETKVEVKFDIINSNVLSPYQKSKLVTELGSKLIQETTISVTSQEKRTQLQNKENAIKKLYIILEDALMEDKERIPTKPSAESINNRLKSKKKESEQKKYRGNLKGRMDKDG